MQQAPGVGRQDDELMAEIEYVSVEGLLVHPTLFGFLSDEALPGSGVEPPAFWAGLAEAVAKFGPRNQELLAVRAGKKDSVVTGPLADLLKATPDQAIVVAVGQVSKEMQMRLSQAFRPVPRRFNLYAVRNQDLHVNARTLFTFS